MSVYGWVEVGGKDNSGALPNIFKYRCIIDKMANILMTVAHLTRGKGDLARTTHQLNGV